MLPSSPWSIEYDDQSCALIRRFGTGEHEIFLELRETSPGDSFRVTVAGKQLAGSRRTRSLRVRFEPDDDFARLDDLYLVEFPNGMAGLRFWHSMRRSSEHEAIMDASRKLRGRDNGDSPFAWPEDMRAAREAEITHLVTSGVVRRGLRLAVGPMGQPMNAMRTCLDELLTHWNIDVEAHKHLTRKVEPVGSPADWLGPGDYPDAMLRRGFVANIMFRLTVSETGNPESCAVTAATTPEEFAKVTCDALMRRAKFKPALDAEGRPIKSYFQSTVRWML